MDPEMYEEIFKFISNNEYPDSATKSEKFTIRRRASNYVLQDKELYYLKHKGTTKELRVKVICGQEAADHIFQEFHCSAFGAHCGQIKTRDAISKRFYWPGMSLDIDAWVSRCVVCQSKRCDLKQGVEYIPIEVTAPFELVGMDLIGKLTKTDDGYQYICVLIDYFTKWPQAYPLKTKSASEVTNCILKFFYQFEAPKRILTDQGKEFVNSINANVCKILGIERSLCAPYHPQTNGLVEKMNGTVQRALGKLVTRKPNQWNQYLDAVMFGLRTKKQITTKYSPFFLMFGREARYPSEIPEHYQVDNSTEQIIAIEDVFIKQHEEILKVVNQNNKASQERLKDRLEKKKGRIYSIGDLVWRKNIREQQRKGGKLDPEFLGPFTVTKTEGKSVDLVDTNGKALPKVNIDHLKPYIEEMPRIPHKLKRKKENAQDSTTITTTEQGSPRALHHITVEKANTEEVTLEAPSLQETYINDAWAGKRAHVLLSRIGPYKLFYWDIGQAGPNQELESEVVNAYLYSVMRKYNKLHQEEALFVDSFEITRIWNSGHSKLKNDLKKFQLIMGVVNDNHHWMLMIIYPKQQKSVLLDPLKATDFKLTKCLESTKACMQSRGCEVGNWTSKTLPHPVQTDGTSCGVFALKFAEYILNDKAATSITFPSTTNDLYNYRKDIALTLLEETDDLSKLCHYCGMKDDKPQKKAAKIPRLTIDWIQCGHCNRWFHQSCVGTDSNFLCAACF